MQFKHPELLWALLLLLIPIFIHLFQLRRFKKTPFTNVKFLKKVVSESRRSSTLKKWLLLGTRLLLFTALILAFAQPFFAKKSALKIKQTVIYLDDSFSMQAKKNSVTLLETAVQELLKSVPEDQKISLFTNQLVFENTSIKTIRNNLLSIQPTAKQLNLDEIYLKANTLFNYDKDSIKDLIVISDFQQRMASKNDNTLTRFSKHFIFEKAENIKNISIDSVFINNQSGGNIELTALMSANTPIESTPVSLFNNNKLIAKTAAIFSKNKKAKVNFTLSNTEVIKGKIALSDTGLPYDNEFYFNIDAKEKIKVLAIGKAPSAYLERIFTQNEFDFTSVTLKALNYSLIQDQNLIILNELKHIPKALSTNLRSFSENDGSLLIIPNTEINFNSYNQFLVRYSKTSLKQKIKSDRNITDISFEHPLYYDVFEKNVNTFQYPKVSQFYQINTQEPSILSFQNKEPFLIGLDRFFLFTAALNTANSNFKKSPLIVPTLYKIGVNSLKIPDLYYPLKRNIKVDIPVQLEKDHVIKLKKDQLAFIPQQKSFAKKVSLLFSEHPKTDGIFSVLSDKKILKNLSFNFTRDESELKYLEQKTMKANTVNESLTSLFEKMKNDNIINTLWKWFVILALLFMLVEVLIQKYL